MNDWDKNNLEFLLSMKTEQEWLDWFAATEEDDHIYAMELIKLAQSELVVKSMELKEEYLEEEDLSVAQAVLSKFRL